jgi:ribulose-phosphate 3-epimerase
MTKIIPAVLCTTFDDVEYDIRSVENVASLVQIDVCDGKFVPSTTWPIEGGVLPEVKDDFEMPGWENLDFELDLMMKNPAKNIDSLINLGASAMVFHYGSDTDENLLAFAREISSRLTSFGLGIQNSHDKGALEKIIKTLLEEGITLYIQVMGIAVIGRQGQPFDSETLETVRYFKNLFPNLVYQVDGGVNEDSIPLLREVGVENFVVGSALYHRDISPQEQYALLKKLARGL